ncbi:hypothetical protein B0H14DRAFT_3507120 [Mycena olivaceomarginata]|nr:hypothetical protein B0H14DRAFT_3507120 [Mycena olivaceomarginata]
MDQLILTKPFSSPPTALLSGRPPSVVQLMTRYRPISTSIIALNLSRKSNTIRAQHWSRMPHPEAHMDFIAESSGLGGAKPWKYFIVDSLDMMNKKFTNPYIVYYPAVSRDGMPFPLTSIRDIQGSDFNERFAWRGNIIIGKFRDHDQPFTSMMDASMADFPILKNFIRTRARLQC